MDSIKVSAKTIDEAKKEAMQKLGVEDESQIEFQILDEGSKGFLGIFGGKEAVVKAVKKEDPCKIAERFLKEVFLTMGLVVKIESQMKDKHIYINISGDQMGLLIGKRGQTLDSIQYLTNLVVNKSNNGTYLNVTIDTENYRQRRKETLEILAINLAKKVKNTGKSVVLEPMNPYERRIIHSALQNDRYVKTYSEGEEPFRNVVIARK